MRSGKPWIKKLLLFAIVLAVVGVGVNWAVGMDKSKYEQALSHAKQSAGQYLAWNKDKALDRPNAHHEKGMRGGFQKHHGLHPGIAIGGTIAAAGLLYWVLRRRKKSSGTFEANAIPLTSSASDFLDQWEKNQTKSKESN